MKFISTKFIFTALLFWMLCTNLANPGFAQNNGYTSKQITSGTVDHKWPSINNHGDMVWCQQVGGYWQIFLNGAQLTSSSNDYRYPVIDDAGDIVYVEYGVGQGVARSVIRHPNGTIEFSSRNSLTGAHRDAGEHFGISSDGNVVSYHDFDPRGGSGTNARFFTVSSLGNIYNDYNSIVSQRTDYPDINKDNDVVYIVPNFSGSGTIYLAKATTQGFTSPTFIASGTEPRVADRVNGATPEIVYLSGTTVKSTLHGNVDTGLWADVDSAGDVIYEQQVGSVSQIFLAKRLALPAPTNLTVTTVSATALNLAWNYGSDPIDGFKIERKTGNGSFAQINTVGAGMTTYPDTGLMPNTTYTYQVRAYRGTDNSDYSNPASNNTSLAVPTNLSAMLIATTKVQIAWNYGSDPIDGFKIERRTDSSAFSEIVTVGSNVTTFADMELDTNTNYTYRVRAYQGIKNSDYSNEASISTKPLSVTDILLGLPHFDSSNNLVVSVYLKGKGSGEYTGHWVNGTSPIKEVSNTSIDLSDGQWHQGDTLSLPWATVANQSLSLKFVIDGQDIPETLSLSATITGFRPDINGWPFSNNFSVLNYALYGVCLGMADSARRYYEQSLALPSYGRQLYTYFLGLQFKDISWLIPVDAKRELQAPRSEVESLFAALPGDHPQTIGLSGQGVVGHSVLVTAAFASDRLYDWYVQPQQEASGVRVFAVYDPDLPGKFNHIYITTPGSNVNAYTLRFFVNVVSGYRNLTTVIDYTGP